MTTGDFFTIITGLALLIQVTAAAICVAKIGSSRRLADRIVAADLLLIVIVGGVAIYSARGNDVGFLDVLLVGSLVTFVGSILAARLMDGDRR